MAFGSNVELRERIKRMRLLRRWDQAALAEATGTSVATISQIENGRLAPSLDHVESFSRAFGCEPRFLAAELELLPTTRPWLRAYADASRREADARTAGATIAAEYIRLLKLKPLPDLLPVISGDIDDDDAIEEIASECRLLADIPESSVVLNATRAAERLGVVVLPLESELGRHLGMSVRADNIPMISVAKAGIPGDRQRFTIAHELGHHVLHRSQPPPRDADESNRLEKQAHRFAAAFLAPADPIVETLHQLGGRVTLRSLQEVKGIWGVAIKALVGRYRSLGVLTDDQARSLYKQISARRWTKEEPVPVANERAQWFVRSLQRFSGVDDLAEAANLAAASVGGVGQDLRAFADWSERDERPRLSVVR